MSRSKTARTNPDSPPAHPGSLLVETAPRHTSSTQTSYQHQRTVGRTTDSIGTSCCCPRRRSMPSRGAGGRGSCGRERSCSDGCWMCRGLGRSRRSLRGGIRGLLEDLCDRGRPVRMEVRGGFWRDGGRISGTHFVINVDYGVVACSRHFECGYAVSM